MKKGALSESERGGVVKVRLKILGLLKVGLGLQKGLKRCGLICKGRIRILGNGYI